MSAAVGTRHLISIALCLQLLTPSLGMSIRSNPYVNLIDGKTHSCGSRRHYDLNNAPASANGKRTKRIVGGSSAVEGQWPWQVIIKESKFFGTLTDYKCGGALISDRFVLTAAHCRPSYVAHLVVVLGQYTRVQKNTATVGVKRMIVHRDFNRTNFHNDIALLELRRAVQLSDKISPICLPDSEDRFVGEDGFVSGWGRLRFRGELPQHLQSVSVPIIPLKKCNQLLSKLHFIQPLPDFFLCAGFAQGQFDACEGDSGGPLVVALEDGRWVLAGLVSHGYKLSLIHI